jgi:tight adherence protein C
VAGNPAGWTVERVQAGKVIGAIAMFFISIALTTVMGPGPTLRIVMIAGGTAIGWFGPNLYLYQKVYDRSKRMQRDLPDAIDLMTISVESGLAFDASVQQVARNTDGPLADEFSRVLREMQIGTGRADALRGLAERTEVDDVKAFVTAMVQADSFGIPIANVLRIQSSEMRIKRRQRAEEKAQKVPVKITIPLIFCILPTLFIAVMGPAVIHVMDSFSGHTP